MIGIVCDCNRCSTNLIATGTLTSRYPRSHLRKNHRFDMLLKMQPRKAWTPVPDRLFDVALAWFTAAWFTASGMIAFAQDQSERAGDKFQNITALKDMPAAQMGKVMNIMSEALGVSCTHCHAGYDFAKEGVPHKDTSRRMIEMTLKLNQDFFGGQTVITCMTCHQGRSQVPDATQSATTLVSAIASSRDPATSNPSSVGGQANLRTSSQDRAPSKEPAVENGLQRFRQIVGTDRSNPSRSSGDRKPHRYQGKRIEPDGKEELEVIQCIAPDTWQQATHYGQLAVTERYVDGKIDKKAGEKTIELKPEERTQIRIEARLALGLDLQSQFNDWQIEPNLLTIDERTTRVLRASEADMTHRFMFDEQSGLLRRRTTTVPTVLGGYVIQVDYEEYREIDGHQVAVLTSVRMPSVRWQRKLESF